MRKLAIGAAFAATTACLSVAVSGIAGSTTPSGRSGPFGVPSAAAAELPAFSDCDELLDWYVEKALPQVGPWGFGYGYPYPLAMTDTAVRAIGLPEEASAASDIGGTRDASVPQAPVGSSETGTNVQEGGVDEPDVAKTDGRLVYRIQNHKLVVTDVTGDEPVELASLKLPGRLNATGLLLVGDTVLLVGSGGGYGVLPTAMRVAWDYVAMPMNAQLAAVDVSDPRKPELVSEHEYEGSLIEARQYGDTVRLVLQTGYPELDFVHPTRRRTEQEATKENREIVRNSTIEEWLPTAVDDGARSALLDCSEVRHPTTDPGLGTISIITFDASDPSDRTALGVTTSGQLAYSSSDRLYVATPVEPEVKADEGKSWWDRLTPVRAPARTEIHAFALEGDTTTYVASGSVAGAIRDRWSFDEHDGELRVATALGKDWEPTDNGVTILRENGEDLQVVGSVRGLGPREEIRSVRWFDDVAIVVTFRQVDPLYTVDLTDPTRPRVVGELKIPGFSSYLHPIGDDRLLGVGTDASPDGRVRGAQIATFDIADLSKPDQLSVIKLKDDELAATYDPHAFTLVGDHAFTVASSWSDGRTRIVKIGIGADGGLTELESFPSRYDARVLPIEGGRVALVGDEVRVVAD